MLNPNSSDSTICKSACTVHTHTSPAISSASQSTSEQASTKPPSTTLSPLASLPVKQHKDTPFLRNLFAQPQNDVDRENINRLQDVCLE